MDEVWKDIEGFEGHYQVSNLGRVKSDKYGYWRELKQTINNRGKGYLRVGLFDGKMKTYSVHRLVAQAFIPNPENKPQVNHIDGNTRNNNVNNLEWCTAMENVSHSIEVLENIKIGSNNGNSKLTEKDIPNIVYMLSIGYTQKEIAEIYGVNQTLISMIKTGRNWVHITKFPRQKMDKRAKNQK